MTRGRQPALAPALKGARGRRQITLSAVNRPDPETVARAAVPLVLDWLRRESEQLQRSSVVGAVEQGQRGGGNDQ